MASKEIQLLGTLRVDPADYSNRSVWRTKLLSEVNTALNSDIPNNARITSAKILLNGDFDGGTDSTKAYVTFGFGHSGQINATLMGATRLTKSAVDYPNSDGAEAKNYFSSLTPPFAINLSSYGSYFVTNMYTSSILIS
jgi:hypothetical protein